MQMSILPRKYQSGALNGASAYIFFKRRVSSSSSFKLVIIDGSMPHTGRPICKAALNSCRARGTAQAPEAGLCLLENGNDLTFRKS